jgi:hypothetical protein
MSARSRKLYAVRTELDFVEIFKGFPPKWNDYHQEWMKFARVYVCGSMYISERFGDLLGVRSILQPNIPRAMSLDFTATEIDPVGLTFCRNAHDYLELYAKGVLLETYCHKTMRAFGFHHLPVGRPVRLVFDPLAYESDADPQQYQAQIDIRAV